MVVVKWSACSSSTLTMTLSSNPAVKFVFEKNENEQKEAGVGPFKKHSYAMGK